MMDSTKDEIHYLNDGFHLVDRCVIKEFIETHHYSHNINGIKSSFCFAMIQDGYIVAACVLGMLSTTSWKKYGKNEHDVIELRRLVMLSESQEPLSRFVGRCIRYVKSNTDIQVVVSYADPHYDHHGGIYQATNFFYLGTTAQDTGLKDMATGRIYHSRAMRTKYKGRLKPFAQRLKDQYDSGNVEEITLPGKHIYAFPLSKTYRKQLIQLAQDYPKPDEDRMEVTSS